MFIKKNSFFLFFSIVILVSGCQSNEQYYQADVYTSDQINSKQETSTIQILSILPAKIAIDNTENKAKAQTAGAVTGAVAGALIGYRNGNIVRAVVGGYGGGVVGSVAGSTVRDKQLVEGVSLTYKDGTKIYTSTQVGKACQFQLGLAVVITTKVNETRVQPNAVCPSKPGKG